MPFTIKSAPPNRALLRGEYPREFPKPPPVISGWRNELEDWWFRVRTVLMRIADQIDELEAEPSTITNITNIAGDTTAAAQVQMYHLKSVEDDYLVCRTWNGVTEGATDVRVAKQYKHRLSLTSETVLGVVHNYTYYEHPDEPYPKNNAIRKVTDGTIMEYQMIIPPWCVDDIIFGITCANTGVTGVTRLDISDSRIWGQFKIRGILGEGLGEFILDESGRRILPEDATQTPTLYSLAMSPGNTEI